jgi:hypothetical protein
MFQNLTAAAAREHVRDLRTIADRDRTIAQLSRARLRRTHRA